MTTQNSNLNLKMIVVVLLILSAAGVWGFDVYKNKTAAKLAVSCFNDPSVKYSVVVKENPTNKTKTDVYLKNPETNQETFCITLSDIYRNHYHNAEYHNGNLYIIHRTGLGAGSETNPNWTDKLWRYSKQKPGQKLYSASCELRNSPRPIF